MVVEVRETLKLVATDIKFIGAKTWVNTVMLDYLYVTIKRSAPG